MTWHGKVDESQVGHRQACWWLGLHNTFALVEVEVMVVVMMVVVGVLGNAAAPSSRL